MSRCHSQSPAHILGCELKSKKRSVPAIPSVWPLLMPPADLILEIQLHRVLLGRRAGGEACNCRQAPFVSRGLEVVHPGKEKALVP